MNGIRYQQELIQPSMCLDEMFNHKWLKFNRDFFREKVNESSEDLNFDKKKFIGLDILDVYYPKVTSEGLKDFTSQYSIPFYTTVDYLKRYDFRKYFFEFFDQLQLLQNGGSAFPNETLSIMNDKQHYFSKWNKNFTMFNYKIDRRKLLEFERINCYLLKKDLKDEVLNTIGTGKNESGIEPNLIIINFSKNTKLNLWDFDGNKYNLDGVINLVHGSDHITISHTKSSEIELVFYCWLNVCENHYTKFILDMLLFSYSIWRKK